jgi:hypothetical protein
MLDHGIQNLHFKSVFTVFTALYFIMANRREEKEKMA